MCKKVVRENVIIDAMENVMSQINSMGSKQAQDMDAVIRFIQTEKNTMFYVDDKMNCSMEPCNSHTYLWLDTGYTDYSGSPILVSLLKNGSEYVGHYTGNINMMAKNISGYFPQNSRTIRDNKSRFTNKYAKKAAMRNVSHISDEQEYLLTALNEDESKGDMFYKLAALNIDFAPEIVEEAEPEIEKEVVKKEFAEEFTELENDITVELLLDRLASMENQLNELVELVDEMEHKDRMNAAEIERLSTVAKSAQQAMVQMREEMTGTDADLKLRQQEKESEYGRGHAVLGRNKKVLVFGATQVPENEMRAIAKLFGFKKDDLVFENDFTKLKTIAGRTVNSERYAAVIFGGMPHSVKGKGDYSSIIEAINETNPEAVCVKATEASGELKLSKTSFKSSLATVVRKLEEQD